MTSAAGTASIAGQPSAAFAATRRARPAPVRARGKGELARDAPPAGKPNRLAAANAKRFQKLVLYGRAADIARGGCVKKQRATAPAPV